MPADSHPDRRAFYRLHFPAHEQPIATISDEKFSILELSEGGCRFQPINHGSLQPGQAFAGMISFNNGTQQPIEGTILRVEGSTHIVQFSKGVTLRTMMELQRDLARRYPQFNSSAAQKH